MRKLQLEYGAEIGRPVVNFKGPVVFCVISRYHGGAYVVFSRMLNDQSPGTGFGGDLCLCDRRCAGGRGCFSPEK